MLSVKRPAAAGGRGGTRLPRNPPSAALHPPARRGVSEKFTKFIVNYKYSRKINTCIFETARGFKLDMDSAVPAPTALVRFFLSSRRRSTYFNICPARFPRAVASRPISWPIGWPIGRGI